MKRTMLYCLLLFGVSAVAAQSARPVAEEPAAQEQTDMQNELADPQPAADGQPVALDKETPARLWDAANTAYIDGDYHAATKSYEQLVARGYGSSKLFYNLANSYFKQERIGRAILFYRRALRLDPGNADARYNLAVAEARTKDRIERVPEFFLTEWFRSIRRTMSSTAWSVLSLAALACGLAAFLLYLLAQRLSMRKAGFYGTLAAAAVFVLTTCFAASERRDQLDRTEAVVMASSAAVSSAPDKSATDLFILHEGTTVQIVGRLDKWSEVTIADGKKGWIENSKIETI
ncbi:MAG: tetratricopeptide repeat protein [Alistipes senegalensis]|nr:tetratricopeptide repeat protein [Bacteroides cellulosilyticus]MCM1352027.1 tetratricopeptide repeat protein [Alistipes senegalensis]